MCTMENYLPDDPGRQIQGGHQQPQFCLSQPLPPELPRNVAQQPAQGQVIQQNPPKYFDQSLAHLENKMVAMTRDRQQKQATWQLALAKEAVCRKELAFMKELKEQPVFPNEFPGPCNMSLAATSHVKNKPDHLYCCSSQCLFTKNNTQFSLKVKANMEPWHRPKWISTSVVFADENSSNDIVRTCQQHAHSYGPPEKMANVLRTVDVRASYRGGPRYSVLHPVTLLGDQIINLSVVCLTLCPTGINRRPTNLIVEILNDYGYVLGRQKLGIHISTTPGNDYRSITSGLRSDDNSETQNNDVTSGLRSDDNSETQNNDVRIYSLKRKRDETVSITLSKQDTEPPMKRCRLI